MSALSCHRRKRWQAAREQACTPRYTVGADDHGKWLVLDAAARQVAGPFTSNSAAWEWIDRHTTARRYGAEE